MHPCSQALQTLFQSPEPPAGTRAHSHDTAAWSQEAPASNLGSGGLARLRGEQLAELAGQGLASEIPRAPLLEHGRRPL